MSCGEATCCAGTAAHTVEKHGHMSLPLVTLCRAWCKAMVHQAGLVELPKPDGLSGRHSYSLAYLPLLFRKLLPALGLLSRKKPDPAPGGRGSSRSARRTENQSANDPGQLAPKPARHLLI